MINSARCIILAALVILSGCGKPTNDQPVSQEVIVILPERDNLQWLNFYVAQWAGYFEDSLVLKFPESQRSFNQLFDSSGFRVAVLPRPLFFEFAASHQPVTAIANLLQHDPVNLVVRPEITDQREVNATQSNISLSDDRFKAFENYLYILGHERNPISQLDRKRWSEAFWPRSL